MYKPITRPPILILVMALVHILTPLLYLFLVRFYDDNQDFYFEVTQFLLEAVPWTRENIYSLILSLCSGICLLLPRKLLWLLGMVALVAISGIQFDLNKADGIFYFQPLALIPFFTVSLIIFYFRNPYLDQRDHWYYKSHRYNTSLPVHVVKYDKTARLVNISIGGACIQWSTPVDKPSISEIVDLHMPGHVDLKAVVVWDSGSQAGVAFQQLTGEQRSLLRKLLKRVQAKEI